MPYFFIFKYMLEKTEREIPNEQSRDTSDIVPKHWTKKRFMVYAV
jgi:hypothetical protein